MKINKRGRVGIFKKKKIESVLLIAHFYSPGLNFLTDGVR